MVGHAPAGFGWRLKRDFGENADAYVVRTH